MQEKLNYFIVDLIYTTLGVVYIVQLYNFIFNNYICNKKETIIFALQSLKMIQRIQSIYLLLSAIISGGLIFVFHLWTTINEVEFFANEELLYLGLFFGSAVLALVAIFMYKKRQTQFVLGRLNIILNFILLGLFVYRSLNLSGETNVSEKGIGILLPIFSIVFLVLANKAIKKDEDLVKSVDRLR